MATADVKGLVSRLLCPCIIGCAGKGILACVGQLYCGRSLRNLRSWLSLGWGGGLTVLSRVDLDSARERSVRLDRAWSVIKTCLYMCSCHCSCLLMASMSTGEGSYFKPLSRGLSLLIRTY